MDFTTLTDDELADAGAAWFREVERRIAASTHPQKDELAYLTHAAHRKMNRVHRKIVETGDVQPFSGGIPKPEGE